MRKSIPAKLRREVYEIKGTFCHYCEKDIMLLPQFNQTLDHLIPVSDGGFNTLENLVPCCRTCNGTRGDFLSIDEAKFMAKYKPLYKSYKYKNQNKKRVWYVIMDEVMMMAQLCKDDGIDFTSFDSELIARAKKAVAAREAKKWHTGNLDK